MRILVYRADTRLNLQEADERRKPASHNGLQSARRLSAACPALPNTDPDAVNRRVLDASRDGMPATRRRSRMRGAGGATEAAGRAGPTARPMWRRKRIERRGGVMQCRRHERTSACSRAAARHTEVPEGLARRDQGGSRGPGRGWRYALGRPFRRRLYRTDQGR